MRTITESSSREVKLASSSNYCNASLARLLAASSRKNTINQSINQRFALKAFLELKFAQMLMSIRGQRVRVRVRVRVKVRVR